MKQKLTLLLLFICTLNIVQIKAQSLPGLITPDARLDTVFDRFGNKYSLKNIAVDTTSSVFGGPLNKTTQLCNAGYFDLYFETGCGMEGSTSPESDRRAVICQVFSDISTFIGSPLNNTGQKVKIWVRDINYVLGTSPGGVLGLATSFYSAPYNATAGFGGIADNEIWKTIHTGVDSYSNTCSPLMSLGGPNSSSGAFFHGMMAFNFTSGINWNTVLTTPTITAGYLDLYSIALHEITHALGFASLINYNGTSKFGAGYNYYSRYDLFLKKGNANLITNTGACNSMYNYQFNSALSTTVVTPGCTITPTPTTPLSTDVTTCSVSITYSGSTTVPVYTPKCFEPPSSLSHFEDICQVPGGFSTTCTATPANNNLYYVMSNANGGGNCFLKRYLKPEERQVLCDIGYSVNTTYGISGNYNYFNYGGSPCSGIDVAGVNDGVGSAGAYSYLTSSGATVAITGILTNDRNAFTFECLQDVYTPSAYLSATSGNSLTSITFSSTATGAHLLRYVPVSSSGKRGNITYVYVYVTTPSCTPSACNLVNNGGYETATNCGQMYTSGSCPSAPEPLIDCWYSLSGTPDAFVRGCTTNPCGSGLYIPTPKCSPAAETWNTPTPGLTNNNILGLFSNNQWLPTTTLNESIQGSLSAPLQPNTTYILSFVARVANNYIGAQNLPGAIEFGGSNSLMAPISYFFNTLPPGLTPLKQITIPNNNQWNYYSVPISYTTAINLNFISIINAGYLNGNSVNTINYVLIDDISIKPLSQAVTFSLPSPVSCSTATLSNLHSYLTPAVSGGIFSGPGVTGSGGVYSFSSALAGVGTHNIAFTYTNVNGCQQTVASTITVTNASTISVTAGSTTSITCNGSVATLTATGLTTYTWNPGNLSGNTVTVSPSSTTSYTVQGSVCSSTAQIIVTVTVNSVPTVTAMASPTVICSAQSSTLTAGGATTYSWNTGPTTPSIPITPSITAIYTVTGTSNGCSATRTVQVNVKPQYCCQSASFSIGSATTTANYSNNSNGSGAVVDVLGSITFTANSTMTNYVLRMAPTSTININSGVTVTFSNCTIYSCTDLWGGIFITDGVGIPGIVNVTNSRIEDMYMGITHKGVSGSSAGSADFIKVTNSVLNNNYISIHLRNYARANSSNGREGLSVTGTTITSQPSPTSPQTTLKTSTVYAYAYNNINNTSITYTNFPRGAVGIYLYNLEEIPVIIGDSTGTGGTNRFENLDFGVYAENASPKAFNNHFINIKGSTKQVNIFGFPPPPTPAGPAEIGVAFNATLTFTNQLYFVRVGKVSASTPTGGNPFPGGNKFENCGKGIAITGYQEPYIRGNLFTATETDVPPLLTPSSLYSYYKAQNAVFIKEIVSNATIQNNYILNHATGIYTSYNTNSMWGLPNFVKIEDNLIEAPSATGFCRQAINVEQVLSTPNLSAGGLIIKNNTISNVYNGIRANNIKGGLQINSNPIIKIDVAKLYGITGINAGQINTYARTGILAAGCVDAVIANNPNIIGNGTINPASTYYTAVKGIWFNGSSGTTGQVNCNVISNMGRCMQFSSTSLNKVSKNVMNGTYQGLVLSTNGIIGAQGTSGTMTNDNEWHSFTGGAAQYAETYTENTSTANTFPSGSVLFVKPSSPYQPTQNYSNVSGNQYITAPGSGIDVQSSGTAGESCLALKVIGGANTNALAMKTTGGNTTYSTSIYESLASDSTFYEVYPNETQYRNKQLVYELLNTQSIDNTSVLQDFYTANQSSTYNDFINIHTYISNGDYSSAQNLNNSVAAANTIETYRKRVNELLLKYLSYQPQPVMTASLNIPVFNNATKVFDDTELNDLNVIANSCLDQYGNVVTQARVLLNNISNRIIDFEDNCVPKYNQRKAKSNNQTTIATSNVNSILYPNPNNGNMILEYNLGIENKGEMRIFDISGKLVSSYNLQQAIGKLEINEQNLINGVYYYSIILNGKVTTTNKIVIIK